MFRTYRSYAKSRKYLRTPRVKSLPPSSPSVYLLRASLHDCSSRRLFDSVCSTCVCLLALKMTSQRLPYAMSRCDWSSRPGFSSGQRGPSPRHSTTCSRRSLTSFLPLWCGACWQTEFSFLTFGLDLIISKLRSVVIAFSSFRWWCTTPPPPQTSRTLQPQSWSTLAFLRIEVWSPTNWAAFWSRLLKPPTVTVRMASFQPRGSYSPRPLPLH